METDIKEADVKKLLKIRMKLLPLDAPIADSDDCFSLQSVIPSNELAADTLLIFSEREEKLKDLLERLPENIQKIVKLRFGLGDGQPQTLEEIAVVQGVTRERIRQMQQQGLRFLQLEIQKLGYAIPPDAILKDPKAPIPKKCQGEEIYKKPTKKALKNSPPEAATSLKAA